MGNLKFVGALALAFILGGFTTLMAVPRNSPATAASSAAATSISPEELTRSAGPMPEMIVENYH